MSIQLEMNADEICAEAQALLEASPYRDLHELRLTATSDRQLRLRGTVNSYYQKQLAQEQLRKLSRLHDYRISNEIEVYDVFSN